MGLKELLANVKRVLKRLYRGVRSRAAQLFGLPENREERLLRKAKGYFDADWYCMMYPEVPRKDAYTHYLTTGWKDGYDPSGKFSTRLYLKNNPDVASAGVNPLVHYLDYGRYENFRMGELGEAEAKYIRRSKYFNVRWYKKHYMKSEKGDPALHYLNTGWKKSANPSKKFSTMAYLLNNPDVRIAGMNPLLHYEMYGAREKKRLPEKPQMVMPVTPKELAEHRALQNRRIAEEYSRDTRKLIVYLVPDFDQICGGMMCITNYAHDIRDFPEVQDYGIMLATIPSPYTFSDYTKFDAHNHIFRFEQIRAHFKHLDRLILHIPEYQMLNFMYNISAEDLAWLGELPSVRINLMNQNSELMPEPEFVRMLRVVVPEFTMTCAHRKYCNANLRNTYEMPLHFVPADKKIKFSKVPYQKKKDILLLSPDPHYAKAQIVRSIEERFPKIKVIVIENMAFAKYLKLIARAKWMITFGEGFDGYMVESLYSDTISFAVFNENFFEDDFEPWPNMYATFNEMLDNIAADMQRLDNEKEYNAFLKRVQKRCEEEFANHEYEACLEKYYKGDYTLPYGEVEERRRELLARQPKVSVVMYTENSGKYLKEQLESIASQSYENLEVIVSDDASNDKTRSIVNSFEDRLAIRWLAHKKPIGENACLQEGIAAATGEFIALSNADDIWKKDKIQSLLDHIETFDIAFGKLTPVGKSKKYLSGSPGVYADPLNQSRDYNFRDILWKNVAPGCSALMRAEFVKGCPPFATEAVPLAWWYTLQAAVNGNGCVFSGTVAADYRDHPDKFEIARMRDTGWYAKQTEFMQYLLDNLQGLSGKQQEQVRTQQRWFGLYDAFNWHVVGPFENFMVANRSTFTAATLNEICDKISVYCSKAATK